MKPKPIGIVGGAGPLAGASLLERILSLAGSKYGCYKDADFPEILLLSFPFSEMLTPETDVPQLQKELKGCLDKLRRNGASILAIACNTLHVFLDEKEEQSDLIHLPRALAAAIPASEIPLVLCTSTAARSRLHKRFFPCVYPSPGRQLQIDRIINQILRGADQQAVVRELSRVLSAQPERTIILGCTELSLYSKLLPQRGKTVIDPMEIVVGIILEKSFYNCEGK